MIASTIDRLYEMIVRFSVYSLTNIHDTFSLKTPPTTQVTEYESLENLTETDTSEDVFTFKTVEEVLREKPVTVSSITHSETSAQKVEATPVRNMIMYTSSIDVPVYTNPTVEFDTKIASIPYGEMVMMIDVQGRFQKIIWNNITGWVLKDDVVDRAADIHPSLIIGEDNASDHPNTIHIRAVLGDVFGIARADFPLQAGEYVLYKLWEKDHHIVWPETRPRTPGLWHKILRGVPNIHIGVMPKVGSVMEYVHEDSFGHLAYVEAVFPDETIAISEANFPDSGKYNERTLTKNEWKELRPVFIQVH